MNPFMQGPFPRAPLVCAAVMIVLTVATVGGLRLSGWRPADEHAAAVSARALRFADQADGGISVTDASTGRLITTVEPGTNGFLRATVRGLASERKREGAGPEMPFILIARVDGALTLMDPATRRSLDLEAFGPTNAAAFARLISARSNTAAL